MKSPEKCREIRTKDRSWGVMVMMNMRHVTRWWRQMVRNVDWCCCHSGDGDGSGYGLVSLVPSVPPVSSKETYRGEERENALIDSD